FSRRWLGRTRRRGLLARCTLRQRCQTSGHRYAGEEFRKLSSVVHRHLLFFYTPALQRLGATDNIPGAQQHLYRQINIVSFSPTGWIALSVAVRSIGFDLYLWSPTIHAQPSGNREEYLSRVCLDSES